MGQSWSAPWKVPIGALLLCLIALPTKKSTFLVLAFAILLGSSAASLRQSSLESSVLHKYFNQSVEATLEIATDPARTASKVHGQNFLPPSYSFLARARAIKVEGKSYTLRIPVRVISTHKSVYGLLPGQTIKAQVRIAPSRERRVAALLLIHSQIDLVTEPSLWARSLARIRLGLRSASGGGDSGALIPGMVLGDTSKQSDIFKSDMRRSGLTHLVAVSGANFAIVSGFVLWCMQFLFRSMKWRISATALSLFCFIALVRPSPSVLRAAAMASVLLIATASRRGRDSLPALGFAIAAVVMGDPWQAGDPGFALSVLATAGLLLFAPKIVAIASRYMPSVAAHALAPPIAAMVFCAPIIVAISGFLSPMSIAANLLAAPAVAPITIIGFISALISPFFPWLSTALIFLVKPLASWISWTAHWCAQSPVISIRSGLTGFAIIGLLIALFFLIPKKYLSFFLIFLLLMTFIQRFPSGDWQVANCDIGQGDSMVINLGNHKAIVIDAGPDPILADRCLKQLGVDEIPLLVLTHAHADHIGGLSGVEKERKIGTQWFGNIRRGTTATIMSNRGLIRLRVLWPDGGEYTPNNSSIALMINAPDYSLFAGGDLEPETQALVAPALGKVDIYKVCHHGSAYQDETFTRALDPDLAIISVGEGNSYGHPAPKTVASLVRLGAKVLRTDRDGAVAVTARSHRLSVRTSKSRWKLFHWE